MTTASDRLVHLAGRSGTAAALLIAVAAGATTGEALVRYSELPQPATAAEHILVDHVSAGAGRKKQTRHVAASTPTVVGESTSSWKVVRPYVVCIANAHSRFAVAKQSCVVVVPFAGVKTTQVGEDCGSAFRVVEPCCTARTLFSRGFAYAAAKVASPVCVAYAPPVASYGYALHSVEKPSTIQNPTLEMLLAVL